MKPYNLFQHVVRISLLVYIGMAAGCVTKDEPPAGIPVTPRDTTITEDNAVTLLQIDSLAVQRYLDSARVSDTSRQLISNFYNSRNYQYAWFDEKGLTEHAAMLWNLYRDYAEYGPRVPAADSMLRQHMERWLTDTMRQVMGASAKSAELQLTQLFFDYAFAKYMGNLDPADLQWYIPRRKVNVTALLDSLVAGRQPVDDWEPLHPQYRLLRHQLLTYTGIADRGGWDSVFFQKKSKLSVGDCDSGVVRLKRRLQATGQFPNGDTSACFTRSLRDSLIAAQRQFGLQADGVVGASTLDALNVRVERRIEQILVNMERMRWLPRQPEGTWILANIPSFRLQVFEGDSSVMRMNIVVGTAATRTVIFSDELKYIVFSPYWNVPASIVRHEIVPALRRDSNYLRRSHMEQTGTRNGLPVIRQLPGPGNALGQVKFLFPNNYNIYLHDTPAKSYFGETSRAFSHGCVRVSRPYELAKFLLRSDTTWTERDIRAAMHAGKEKWVALSKTVPVFLTYFTAWVADGHLQFRKDIYGHDERMKRHLFSRNDDALSGMSRPTSLSR